jgi:riboflavin synthase alpha subunit
MFTGIVEAQGRLVRLEAVGKLLEMQVDVAESITSELQVGDSIALSGCCLTVTAVQGPLVSFQAVPETLRLTSLGDRRVGDRVNVERAMRADARFGGHIVQGHVDGTGRVADLRRDGDEVQLRIECAPKLAGQLVQKGSVTVDGVSLTVVDPDDHGFSLALIPHTLAETTLGAAEPGDRVNLEVDVLGKYVLQYLDRMGLVAGSNGPKGAA